MDEQSEPFDPRSEAVTAKSWKTLPAPTKKVPLGFVAFYSDADAEKIMAGLRPRQMEDKWFIYSETGWVYFHRSWTGACIFAVRLDGSPAGVRVVDSWVNRDPEQYKATDIDYDRKLIGFLIDALLLHKSVPFPRRSDVKEAQPGVYQHSVVGRGYPKVEHRPGTLAGRIVRFLRRK